MEDLDIRPRLYSGIHVTEAVKENHDLSLGIDETQENSIAFKEMCISKWAKVRHDMDRLKWSRTLQRCPRGHEKIEKIAHLGQEWGHRNGRAAVCAVGRLVSVKCGPYIRSLCFAVFPFCRL